jgi:hypothetical protein
MQREIQAPADMADYYVYRYYTEDGEAIFELRRVLQSPWREDLLPAVQVVMEIIGDYRVR